jgi:hypothetical protein
MKTTLDLPDDLMREVKLRAVEEQRKLENTIADLLRRGLDQEQTGSSGNPRRVELPLVKGAHKPRPEEELTPERLAEILIEQEAEWQRELTR